MGKSSPLKHKRILPTFIGKGKYIPKTVGIDFTKCRVNKLREARKTGRTSIFDGNLLNRKRPEKIGVQRRISQLILSYFNS